MRFKKKVSVSVILLIFFSRTTSLIVERGTGANFPHRSDATTFAHHADRISGQLVTGEFTLYLSNYTGGTNEMWPFLLSPFWLLPGPSQLYATVFLIIISTIAVYNVYVIAQYYHSHTAGVFAILPIALMPNYVVVHASLLRDGVVLFCLIAAVRYLAIPDRPMIRRVAYSGLLLAFSIDLRDYNLFVITPTVGVLVIFYLYSNDGKERVASILTMLLSIVAILYSKSIREFIEAEAISVAGRRSYGARGRTAYLPEPIPESLLEVLQLSPVTTIYFLYTPFPWMIEHVFDLVGFIESTIYLFYTILMLYGVRYMLQKNHWVTLGIILGFILGIVMWGLGSANVGQAARHRQMFVWVICLFGGIGLAHLVNLK